MAGLTDHCRRRLLLKLLFFWTLLGFGMNWKKLQYGPEVQWIRVELTLAAKSVEITLSEAKTNALVQALREFHGKDGSTPHSS
eukprot:688644-Amphidinium_carterae.1